MLLDRSLQKLGNITRIIMKLGKMVVRYKLDNLMIWKNKLMTSFVFIQKNTTPNDTDVIQLLGPVQKHYTIVYISQRFFPSICRPTQKRDPCISCPNYGGGGGEEVHLVKQERMNWR